ncbi:response regulator receiver modulated diguanylate cyclase/phosphodiesterase [Stanieria sp. NIES-3757]|nr:response regulator receiver modulated diguanylate cyclase/phosphodiesterase [Stanieria sp. NIES-3757]
MVVDDEPNNFDVIETLLYTEGYVLNYASNGQKALERLDKFKPDLILLDVMMPELNGFEVCQRIKTNPTWQHIPIIMITALDSKETLANSLEVGADDFICKPVSGIELKARIRSLLRISQQHQSIQKLCEQLQCVNQQLTELNIVLEKQVKERTAQLEKIILYDELTQLPSRIFLFEKLEEIVRHRKKQPPTQNIFALLYLDCDRFKLVNSALGYQMGDQLLVAIAQRLQQYLSPQDLLAYLGGDEFCFFLDQRQNKSEIEQFAQTILESFNLPFIIKNQEIFTTACIGIALEDCTYQTPQQYLQNADIAMYKAKLKGKGCYQFFDMPMYTSSIQNLQLNNDLRKGLEKEEFLVYYQPIVKLTTLEIIGFEALIRWQHPERGLVSPSEFITFIEETGLIIPIGLLVLKQACQQLRLWEQNGYSDLIMSVNLSVYQFAHPTLLEDIDRVLQETEISPACLKLEITESAIMENTNTAILLTQELQARQIQISIDDFGTGYSSLGYLSQFPVDSIKIDRSFVKNISDNQQNVEIIKAITSIGHTLSMTIIAEGIETEQQLAYLRELGCELGQGYLFAKPLNSEQATAILKRRFLKVNQAIK